MEIINKPRIFVFNKIDLLPASELSLRRKKIEQEYNPCIFVSAETGKNIAGLRDMILSTLTGNNVRLKLFIPYNKWPSFSFLYQHGKVLKVTYNGEYTVADVEISELYVTKLLTFTRETVKQKETILEPEDNNTHEQAGREEGRKREEKGRSNKNEGTDD